jgi:hypothetical protein
MRTLIFCLVLAVCLAAVLAGWTWDSADGSKAVAPATSQFGW